MRERLDAQINTRMTARDKEELGETASSRQMDPLALARTLLREGIRRERHPGITFRIGPTGRRAALEGHRLDVWQVMETVWASDGAVNQVAAYLEIHPADVQAAVAYYADYPEEVDAMVEQNRQAADRLQAQWHREQAALRR